MRRSLNHTKKTTSRFKAAASSRRDVMDLGIRGFSCCSFFYDVLPVGNVLPVNQRRAGTCGDYFVITAGAGVPKRPRVNVSLTQALKKLSLLLSESNRRVC